MPAPYLRYLQCSGDRGRVPAALNRYLAQLEENAASAGVDLAEACRQEGIARTTLYRWRKGEAFPREATAVAIMRRIASMASERAA